MAEVVRPSMDLARRVGLRIVHVETDWMDTQYPHVESRRSSAPAEMHPHQRAMLERAHGIDYMTRSPLASMRRAELVSPQGEEPLFFYSDTLDEGTEYYAVAVTDTIVTLHTDVSATPANCVSFSAALATSQILTISVISSTKGRITTDGTHGFEGTLAAPDLVMYSNEAVEATDNACWIGAVEAACNTSSQPQ